MSAEKTSGRVAVTRDTVIAGLFTEASCQGKESTQSNRIKAWELLARILGCFDGHKEGGEVRVFFDIKPESAAPKALVGEAGA